MIREINLQKQGYGFPPVYDKSISDELNKQKYEQYYENYWFNIPGTPVSR